MRQYHLYRDMRTYGKYELLYSRVARAGSLYLRFPDDEPPVVHGRAGGLTVTVRDLLTGGEEVDIPADLVVLVTGMVPRENEELVQALKLPVGNDGFFNEIHPKLRPVETVVDGVLICGACQGPKNSPESVASGLAAVTQSAAMLKQGSRELDPQVATSTRPPAPGAGRAPRPARTARSSRSRSTARPWRPWSRRAARAAAAACPSARTDAIDLQGYTDAQVRAMIDGLPLEVLA